MSNALVHQIRRRCGPASARLIRALPLRWRSTARRRRFLLLAVCAPGFAAIVALPAHKNLWLLLSGGAWIIAACGLRSLSEPELSSGGHLG
ncbi:MAG TPA: hypothetical protein VL358_09615 [Caulobacteraceae bacterium]|jgi:hypothetical protein|nr:hypothetical protein [Caulobacteraceae bacterium]